MARRSERAGRRGDFAFADPDARETHVGMERRKAACADEGVSVSLKYYRQQAECLSTWRREDLKKLSGTIAKVRGMTAAMVRNSTMCDKHVRSPRGERFTRPDDLSPDLPMFEIRVDQGNAARIHGTFVGSVFYLVWLDRLHQVHPE